jgi:hypothetical protein
MEGSLVLGLVCERPKALSFAQSRRLWALSYRSAFGLITKVLSSLRLRLRSWGGACFGAEGPKEAPTNGLSLSLSRGNTFVIKPKAEHLQIAGIAVFLLRTFEYEHLLASSRFQCFWSVWTCFPFLFFVCFSSIWTCFGFISIFFRRVHQIWIRRHYAQLL